MVDKKEACRKYGQLISEERSDAVIKLRKWLVLLLLELHLKVVRLKRSSTGRDDESFLQIYQI